ncbi:acyltransferase [Rhodococcus sp. USK10]|uniref:acyltransferase family protein n=1 Tax=Rhodococcus sp. USK10 TaxID=2789739 RepID=UPI001C5D8771|nr:acyltransferase [Rhodococcus sp. USK10]QYB02799.1 acyltransferase [Rhodococcus sp. USK10]
MTTTAATLAPAENLRSLTGLRFFAAIMVVLYHVSRYIPPSLGFDAVFGLGYVGVTFFFVLSGFILTWTYRPGDTPRAFYGRRFARVWPLHVLLTMAALIFLVVASRPQNPFGLALAIPLLQAWAPPGDLHYAYNGVSWTLSCEAFFYAMFPALILVVLSNRNMKRWIAGLVGAMILFVILVLAIAGTASDLAGVTSEQLTGFALYVFPGFRIGEFVLGMMLAAFLRSGWSPKLSVLGTAAAVAAAYIVLLVFAAAFFDSPFDVPMGVIDLVMMPFLAALIVAAAVRDTRKGGGVLTHPALVALGQWSFALYIVHELVIRVADQFIRVDNAGGEWARALGCVVLSIGLAAALFRLVERPLERGLRHRLGSRASVAH